MAEPDASGATLERLYRLSPLQGCSLGAQGDPLWSHGVFAVSVDEEQPPRTTREPDSNEKCPDYYANVGDAIRTLREDVPALFERELNCARHTHAPPPKCRPLASPTGTSLTQW